MFPWSQREASAPIEAWKCTFRPFLEIMTDRSTDYLRISNFDSSRIV